MAFGSAFSKMGTGKSGGISSGASSGLGFGDYMNFAGALSGLIGGGQQQVQAPPAFQTFYNGKPIPDNVVQSPLFTKGFGGTLDEAITKPPGDNSDDQIDRSKFSIKAEQFLNNTGDLFSNDGSIIGMGLLNQVDPRLMYAAIIANGLKEGGLLGGKSE